MSSNIFGIDLGTSNVKIYSYNDDKVFTQKNMIAIENKNTIFAYGDSAHEMFEKAPGNISVSYPLFKGVIADINNMETLIKLFIEDIQKSGQKPSDYYVAVPTDVSDVEKKAFYDLINESKLKAKNIYVTEKGVADGLGLGIDVKTSQGSLVVNVGYQTTEISILSLGGIVLSKLLKIGGADFDNAIRNAVKTELNLVIGEKTAEKIKMSIKEQEAQNEDIVVYGRDIVSGLPVERHVKTKFANDVLSEHFKTIIDNVRIILEKTPPELSADIYKNGIYLTGGASLVNLLPEKLANGTGLKVRCTDSPIESVALGLARIIKDDNYKSLARDIERIGK